MVEISVLYAKSRQLSQIKGKGGVVDVKKVINLHKKIQRQSYTLLVFTYFSSFVTIYICER